MGKFKYIILLISVLFFNACTQPVKRTQETKVTQAKPGVIENTEDSGFTTIDTDEPDSVVSDTINESEVEKEVVSVQAEPVEKKQPVIKVVEEKPKKDEQQKPVEVAKVVEKPIQDLNIAKNNDSVIEAKEEQKKEVQLENISGKISLNTDAVDDKEVDIESTVVYFKPNDYVAGILKNEDYLIASQNKRFVPNVLAIQKGSTVTFPNMDRILHNVFSVSNVQKFDLGLYSAGKEKTVTFDNAGIVYVHCNVHHSMQADILVLDTPFYTYVDKNGQFSLKDLPSKSGELYFWHPRAKLEKIVINESIDETKINQTVAVVRKKVPLHKNKFGKSYRPTRDDK